MLYNSLAKTADDEHGRVSLEEQRSTRGAAPWWPACRLRKGLEPLKLLKGLGVLGTKRVLHQPAAADTSVAGCEKTTSGVTSSAGTKHFYLR